MKQNGSQLSQQPYGVELAQKVVRMLKNGHRLCNSHKEYCGIGLFWDYGSFFVVRVYDGVPETRIPSFFKTDSEKAFVAFLAVQSDATMSGAVQGSVFFESDDFLRHNQRITKARLEEFVAARS